MPHPLAVRSLPGVASHSRLLVGVSWTLDDSQKGSRVSEPLRTVQQHRRSCEALWVFIPDFLTYTILSLREMLDRNPAQCRFATHLHADGILIGIRLGIARTDTTNSANTAISTPDKGAGECLCIL
jgi:hypothetical protein